MLEDRLRPRYASRSPGCGRSDYWETRRTASSLQTSPKQRKAKAIVAKYKKKLRYAQLYRLKALVPSLRVQEDPTEVDVLQETARYIEDLERRLLAQVQCAGLPRQLQKYDQKKDDSSSTETSSGSSDSGSGVGAPGKAGMRLEDLRSMLHTSLQPALIEKLKKARAEDQDNIARLLHQAETSSSQQT